MPHVTDVICEQRDRCGLITLNRPNALNALTYDMIGEIERSYITWARDPHIYGVVLQSGSPRAFCSGGDIRALYEWKMRGEIDTVLSLYGLEYQHNWSLYRFVKPNVSLLNGIVMGGGVGLCLYGTHRVATGRLRLAMPEVGIGFFPDVGATWFLSRLPGQIGTYLALTGRAIGLADAFALELVTHCVRAEDFDTIRAAMAEAEPVDPMLEALHHDPGEGELVRLRPVIDRAFSAPRVEDILARLDAEEGEWADWARATAGEMRSKSPLGLKVALRQMRIGGDLGLEQALKLEYRLAHRFITGDEFYEGIRAAIIDKDHTPRWPSRSLEAVSDAEVEALFAPLEGGELALVDPYPDAAGGLVAGA